MRFLLALLFVASQANATITALYRGNVATGQTTDSSGNGYTLTKVGAPGNVPFGPPEGDAWLSRFASLTDYFKVPLAAIPASGASDYGRICMKVTPNNSSTNAALMHIGGTGYFSMYVPSPWTSIKAEYTYVGGGSGSVERTGLTKGVTYDVCFTWDASGVTISVDGIGTANNTNKLDYGTLTDVNRNTIGVNSYGALLWPADGTAIDLVMLSDDPTESYPPSSPETFSADVLVVSGAGAGGAKTGGGGGAGGLMSATANVHLGATYSVLVGAGGLGQTDNYGLDGARSSFIGLTPTGGGGGGINSAPYGSGRAGGSGGGASCQSGSETGGTGVSGQGYAGGEEACAGIYGSGGGGGRGAVGSNGSTTAGGNGGAGLQWVDGTYYAGGGGGGTCCAGTYGTGGTGGGGDAGNAGVDNPGKDGTDGLGGGGGGTSGNVSSAGGDGGDGVVVIRYVTADYSGGTGGTISYSGGYTYHTFTTDGTFVAPTAGGGPTFRNMNLKDTLRLRLKGIFSLLNELLLPATLRAQPTNQITFGQESRRRDAQAQERGRQQQLAALIKAGRITRTPTPTPSATPTAVIGTPTPTVTPTPAP